jgi:hypothetical protein
LSAPSEHKLFSETFWFYLFFNLLKECFTNLCCCISVFKNVFSSYERNITSVVYGFVTIPNEIIMQQRRNDAIQQVQNNAVAVVLPSWATLKPLLTHRSSFLSRVDISLPGTEILPDFFNLDFSFILNGEYNSRGFIPSSQDSGNTTDAPAQSRRPVITTNMHVLPSSPLVSSARLLDSTPSRIQENVIHSHLMDSDSSDTESSSGNENSCSDESVANSSHSSNEISSSDIENERGSNDSSNQLPKEPRIRKEPVRRSTRNKTARKINLPELEMDD